MNKKLLSIFIALVLALSLCLVTAAPVTAATIDVTPGADAIQTAINTAGPGDIINVAEGTYTENIDVNQRVILQASGVVTVNPAVSTDHIFHVTASNVTIDGFTLVGDTLDTTSRGVLLDGVTGCTISNNNWSSTANAGAIWLDGADDNIIQGNTCAFTVTTSGYGIYLLLADSNIVKDNICTGGSENIWIEGSNNTIQGNTCSGSSIGNGIMLSGATVACTGNTIKGNTCSNNDANGISIIAWPNSISDTTVMGNTLTGNSNGILLDSASGAVLGITITENTCQSNTNAIKIYDVYTGSVITISDNDISSNTAVGILIDNTYGNADATYVTASPDNSIVNNTTYGADNQGAGNLDATGNWWGTAVAGEIPAMISGTVTYTGHLTTAPAAVGLTVEPDILPTVATTSPATNISFFSATLNGNLSDMGTATQVDVWFEWGTTTSYGQTTPFETKTAASTFTAGLTGLTQGTEYHFMAVARSADGTTTGADVSFTTPIVPPAVTTEAATNVDLYSATLNGDLTVLGGVSPVTVSFEWDTDSGLPYANETTPVNVTTTGTFTAGLTGLTPGQIYYFRAKAIGDITVYGDEVSFTTVAERIGISVSPTSIDFGSILAGSASPIKTVTVTNEGNIVEEFSASLSAQSPADFYTDNLTIDSVTVIAWSATNIAIDADATPDLQLTMPGGAAAGTKTATITFIAEKQQ